MSIPLLLLSLGHNSSAIYTDGVNNVGYEQERLDQIKSSSAFPIDSILNILKYKKRLLLNGFEDMPVFISHWFDNFDHRVKNKYFDPTIFKNSMIISCDKKFTHHDAHAWSSYSFLKYFSENKVLEPCHYIVADGFGNNKEVLSIYKSNADLKPELIFRVSDYRLSLGLMYQYATSFCGMKENQDEYKFLGYEPSISNLDDKSRFALKRNIEYISNSLFKKAIIDRQFDSVRPKFEIIDFDSLIDTKKYWYFIFKDVIISVLSKTDDEFMTRVVIAHFIQTVLELFFEKLIAHFNIKNVALSGGVFYNVKLNNFILKRIEGYLSIVPLAGDQGAAIGIYENMIGDYQWGDLCWGERDLFGIEKYANEKENIYIFNNEQDALKSVESMLNKNMVVNIVKGSMEFGPRALCNTSTLMLPTEENTSFNNSVNKRNEVMPCAPVMLNKNVSHFFKGDNHKRVIGSDKFMIVTYDYNESIELETHKGVMHKYPDENLYSGRPQVVSGASFMSTLLSNMESTTKCLVNTSFNSHGRPICYNTSSIIQNYMFQRGNCETQVESDKLALVVIKNEQ